MNLHQHEKSAQFISGQVSSFLQVLQLICACFYFNCYLASPRPTLGHYQGGSLTHLMLITCVLHIGPEDHEEPRNEVGSLNSTELIVGFEAGTFWFWSQHLNPLGHFATLVIIKTYWWFIGSICNIYVIL